LYNHQLPQSALKSKTPIEAMKHWYDEKSHLFHRRPKSSNRLGCDSYSPSNAEACLLLPRFVQEVSV
ncbi:MAG: hypothetical protein ACK5NW_15175, partial [Ottowia sp.]